MLAGLNKKLEDHLVQGFRFETASFTPMSDEPGEEDKIPEVRYKDPAVENLHQTSKDFIAKPDEKNHQRLISALSVIERQRNRFPIEAIKKVISEIVQVASQPASQLQAHPELPPRNGFKKKR